MAFTTVTYTFTNGTAADAGAVNTNFADIIAGTSDGTKDFSIAALTTSGNVTFQGNTTVGNASGDDLTVNASLASSIPVKTTASYNVGGSSTGLVSIYFSLGATYTVRLLGNASGASANWTLTLPAVVGSAGHTLVNQGSGTTAWGYAGGITSAKSADYTITTTDLIGLVLMTTSTTDRTVTLPTVGSSTDRIIRCKKVDSATGVLKVTDGSTTYNLPSIDDVMTFQSDGTNWQVVLDGRKQFVYQHGTNYNGGNAPTMTGGAGFAVVFTRFLPYQNADGSWWLRASFRFTQTASTTLDVAIAGVTFLSSGAQVGSSVSSSAVLNTVTCTASSGSLVIRSTGSQGAANVFIDVALDSKPNWAY